jgi:hypothetical protein
MSGEEWCESAGAGYDVAAALGFLDLDLSSQFVIPKVSCKISTGCSKIFVSVMNRGYHGRFHLHGPVSQQMIVLEWLTMMQLLIAPR